MFPAQIAIKKPEKNSRCEERSQMLDQGESLNKVQKTDAAIKETVERAIRKDDVLRAIEYSEIAVHVNKGVIYLNGHIVSTTSQSRIDNAIRAIPGILGIQNHLVLDDKLTHEVAASLGVLEHTYGCKFFTGASHGVVSLNGVVSDANVKLLAEKCVAANPNVRAVINNIHISGDETELQAHPFLQPTIGETIYFLDGVSGVVKQVIMNPNNRCVIAMTVWGQFANPPQELKSLRTRETRSSERVVVLSMDVVRYMTQASGFLSISSKERERYTDFDPASFRAPNVDWTPPYPYCPDDVLFPVEKQEAKYQVLEQPLQLPLTVVLNEQLLWEQLLADNNLGG